ncbi:MAG: hypothetical protein NTW47_22910 [Proteobacteria bacterium]|nr:hypothetical protein [Pseudomonadota bacterium]
MSSKIPSSVSLALPDLDIYRSAHALIEQHGENASFEAAQRADRMLAEGDMPGKAVWLRILKAIDELQSETVPAGTRPN